MTFAHGGTMIFNQEEKETGKEQINMTKIDIISGFLGAGKTTFVKLLKGLLKPVSGKILINGTDISTTTVAELSKQVGMVFQNPDDQIFKYKVIDEVMLVR